MISTMLALAEVCVLRMSRIFDMGLLPQASVGKRMAGEIIEENQYDRFNEENRD